MDAQSMLEEGSLYDSSFSLGGTGLVGAFFLFLKASERVTIESARCRNQEALPFFSSKLDER